MMTTAMMNECQFAAYSIFFNVIDIQNARI